MKKERHWLIFRKDEPENEWESKYIVQQNKTDSWATVASLGLVVLLVSIAIVSINMYPCQAEIEGSVLGTIDFNMSALPPTAIDEAVFKVAKGKIKVSGSCTAVALFTNR